jgi:hypothetical protein
MRLRVLAGCSLLASQLVACVDDPDLGADVVLSVDAPVDVAGDGLMDPPDAGVFDSERDLPLDIGRCWTSACPPEVLFRIPAFDARFAPEAGRFVVTGCRAGRCSEARVERVDAGDIRVTQGGDGGWWQVRINWRGDTLEVSLEGGLLWPRTPDPRVERVELRIVSGGGRVLVDFSTQAPVEVFCQDGLKCGICEVTFVQLDTADGGQPYDGNTHPGRGGLCE